VGGSVAADWALVIFDNDGVLVDSETAANAIMAELLTAAGVPTTPEASVDRFLGRGLPACREIVRAEDGVELPEGFEDEYLAAVYEAFRTTLRPVPGIVQLLDALRDRAVCVASSGGHERIRLALGTTGLLPRFGGNLFSAEDVGRGKPAPDLFLHAAAAMGVAPERCVVIEDSPAGIVAAGAAGMASIGLARLLPASLLSDAGATHVVPDAAAIGDLLGV
jgi:HAD superfamily hydrolase (TIGR01509 family)